MTTTAASRLASPKSLLRAAVPILIALGSIATPADAASWSVRQVSTDHQSGYGPGPLLSVSCPSPALCVAVGDESSVAWSDQPAEGALAWHLVKPEALRGDNPRLPFYEVIRDVSCPSSQLCAAVTNDGLILNSTIPTGGAYAWNVADINEPGGWITHLLGISCPTVSFCLAVSGESNNHWREYRTGRVFWSTDPTGDTSAWHQVIVDPTLDLRAVSCPTTSFCLAAGDHGRMIVSTNPTGGPSAWAQSTVGPGAFEGVSCPSAVLCVAGNAGGNLRASSNALLGPQAAWTTADGGASVQVTGVSCLATGQCAAVDKNGDVMTTTDTTSPTPWSLTNLIPFTPDPSYTNHNPNAIFGASCPTLDFCALAASGWRVFTSTDPFSAPPAGAIPGKRKKHKRRPRRPKAIIADVDWSHPQTRTGWDPVRFRFYARGRVRGFLCKLDDRPYKRCRSPKRYRRVRAGNHIFSVRAIGTTGLRGPVASKHFTIFAV